ncbi:MAG: hypothetical protein ACLQK8_04265 [Streptosporangiaceae bacterium]|jgi:hypothetical protein
MTTLLHSFPGADAYDRRLQQSYLDYVCGSDAASASLAENYVGLGSGRARPVSGGAAAQRPRADAPDSLGARPGR